VGSWHTRGSQLQLLLSALHLLAAPSKPCGTVEWSRASELHDTSPCPAQPGDNYRNLRTYAPNGHKQNPVRKQQDYSFYWSLPKKSPKLMRVNRSFDEQRVRSNSLGTPWLPTGKPPMRGTISDSPSPVLLHNPVGYSAGLAEASRDASAPSLSACLFKRHLSPAKLQ